MSLLWIGQTRTAGGSTAAPAAGGVIGGAGPGTLTLGPGHYEVIVSVGFGSVALGGNDSAINMQLVLAWTGRTGSPKNFLLTAIPAVNTMMPPLIIRDLEVLADMLTVTLSIQAVAIGTGTYVGMMAVTPFSL